ncbi:MAG: amidohydrolase family protein [Sphingobium sp.]
MAQEQLAWIDTHFHLFNRKELTYSWLEKVIEPWSDIMGDYTPLIERGDYMLEDYLAEARPTNVVKLVHADAAFGSRPEDETRWLQKVADAASIPLYIVGHADLSAPDAPEILDRQCESPNFRGIRMLWGAAQADSDVFRAGFRHLVDLDLCFEEPMALENTDRFGRLAKDFPTARIMLGHCGMPMRRDKHYLDNWRASLQQLAPYDNIYCKLSGLHMTDHDWTFESMRVVVETVIDILGPDRCFFASNWPVDSLYGGTFSDLVNDYRRIIESYSMDEQKALLRGNAERFYRI